MVELNERKTRSSAFIQTTTAASTVLRLSLTTITISRSRRLSIFRSTRIFVSRHRASTAESFLPSKTSTARSCLAVRVIRHGPKESAPNVSHRLLHWTGRLTDMLTTWCSKTMELSMNFWITGVRAATNASDSFTVLTKFIPTLLWAFARQLPRSTSRFKIVHATLSSYWMILRMLKCKKWLLNWDWRRSDGSLPICWITSRSLARWNNCAALTLSSSPPKSASSPVISRTCIRILAATHRTASTARNSLQFALPVSIWPCSRKTYATAHLPLLRW